VHGIFFLSQKRTYVLLQKGGMNMLRDYKQTDLEKWVGAFYAELGMRHAGDLREEAVADALGIDLVYRPCPSMRYEAGRYRCITINSALPRPVQREQFFHELGHILRGHTGKQLEMRKSFRDLQEAQASQFQLYAALPFFMVSKLRLTDCQTHPACLLAQEFGVTRQLAEKRLAQIRRRIISERLHRQFVARLHGRGPRPA
jgi:Zn-dependent peptidase ImmA (M78 family)